MNSWAQYSTGPRHEVQGGVVVAKPGKVTHVVAEEMIAAAGMESNARVLARGRTYARAGQVVDVQVEPGAFLANIQGTRRKPYQVRLDRVSISGSPRVAADCDCPYSCDYDWCKHAAALAYVAAFLLDQDAGVRVDWTGDAAEGPAQPVSVPPLTTDELAALGSTPRTLTAADALAAGEAIVPHPWHQ